MIVYSHSRSYASLLSGLNGSDFYQFTLTGSQVVELDLQARFGAAGLVLFDAKGTRIASTVALATADATILQSLAAGTYYVDVSGGSDAGYALQLHTGGPAVGTAATDHAGSNRAGARAMGTLGAAPQSFADWVGARDLDDYYAFTLAGAATLHITLAGIAHNAVLYLRNVSDQQIGYAYGTTGYGASIVQTLAAGTYYVDVQASGTTSATDTGYNLAVTAVTQVDGAGNTLATARALGVIGAGGQRVGDAIGPLDTDDKYGFILAGPSTVTLTLSGLTGGATVSLLDATGRVVGTGSGSYVHNGSVVAQLAAGSYYADVQGGTATPYTLALAAAALADPAGGSAAAAQPLGTLGSAPVALSGWVGPIDAADWYGFTLAAPTTLALQLATWNGVVGGSAGLSLLDAGGNQLASATATPDGAGSLIRLLAAGQYYARVMQASPSSSASYTLGVVTGAQATGVPGSDAAGNTLATARDIGTPGAATQSFADWVGPGDGDDIYRFTLAAPAVVHVVLSGLAAAANLTLETATGQAISTTAGGATASACRDRLLAAGTYYVDVASTAGTGTLLSLAATPVPDLGGGSIATARPVGTLGAAPQDFAGAVLSLATDDFYRIALTQSGVITLQLAGLSAGTYIRLLDANGAQIDSAFGTATADAWVVRAAPAGTYYVDVANGTGDTNYLLSMSAPATGDVGGPSSAAAFQVGVLAPPGVTPGDLTGDGVADLLWRNVSSGAVVAWTMSAGQATAATVLTTDRASMVAGIADVNGDGTADILWRDPATGTARLWLMSAGAVSASSVLDVDPGWILAGSGDFNGDGTDDLLWYNAATDSVTEWTMANGVAVATQVLIANSPWRVVGTGDFNGDGIDDILWRNAATGEVVGWLMGVAGITAVSLLTDQNWTVSGTADVNGDGVTDILWRNLVSGVNVLWSMGAGSPVAASVLQVDGLWQVAGTADINGDGTADIIWRDAASGAEHAWLMQGGVAASTIDLPSNRDWLLATAPAAARPALDLNGDGKSDILWSNAGVGDVVGWQMDEPAGPVAAEIANMPGWSIAGSGDFNGDGRTDVLWRNAASGEVDEWQMAGLGSGARASILNDPAWTVAGTGDLNGDGIDDILWSNASTGAVVKWLMNGFARVSSATVLTDPAWRVAGLGDFNGDGTTDILWRNPGTGEVVQWLLNGNSSGAAVSLLKSQDWTVAGIGDFNGDGTSDLLWRNVGTGEVVQWLMADGHAMAMTSLLRDPSWAVVAVGDYDGDGRADILWRNAGTGETVQWMMNGSTGTSANSLLTSTDWIPMSPSPYGG